MISYIANHELVKIGSDALKGIDIIDMYSFCVWYSQITIDAFFGRTCLAILD